MKTIKQKILKKLHKDIYLFNEKFIEKTIDSTLEMILEFIEDNPFLFVDSKAQEEFIKIIK